MPLDLTGIQNVGEFYSHHYLDALLENDLKGLFAKWRSDDDAAASTTTPDRQLYRLAGEYFKAKTQARPELSIQSRYEPSHRLHVALLEGLGYEYNFSLRYIKGQLAVPILGGIIRDGREYLWLVETPFPGKDELMEADISPLDQRPFRQQYPSTEEPYLIPDSRWEDLVGEIFHSDEPPRWLVFLTGRYIYLIDRTKWGRGQYLLFDLDEILGRRQAQTLRAMAALLSREALCPDEGVPLHDTLDENSHKHAYSVSSDLKYGIRRAVELLANEYVFYQRTVAKQGLFQDEDLARKLTDETLIYLYRLLFLLYAEARAGELDVVPMKAEAYQKGYSLDALRDLEQVPLTTPQAQNGYFLNDSLNRLFSLVDDGYQPQQLALPDNGDFIIEAYDDYGFRVKGLHSPLFSRESTPRLSAVRFRNSVLQEVIQLLSLSREKRGKRSQRGRISYAQLGINQLGAVYEALLSYSGFFATERLYEVKPADTKDADETAQTYFIPESELERYLPEEFVYDHESGQRKSYEKGAFIFRLAGRDREKSASYYTPEVLTQCVVKYSLKELLKDKNADAILKITICEPAMGSGAFINEALNQLADAYLERKQKELGKRIPPDDYRFERQKVKYYLAVNNAYGVDLNPTAVRLAEVSLWLNNLYPGAPAPWFGARLATGNSLIGARRQVYTAEEVKSGAYTTQAPTPCPLQPKEGIGETATSRIRSRPEGSIYHWLLPDAGMAAFDNDKVIKELAPAETEAIKKWHKEFTKPFTSAEIRNLAALSDRADGLWQKALDERLLFLEHTCQPVNVWGQAEPQNPPAKTNIQQSEKELAWLQRPTGPYARLKLAMDYWCALWFWQISAVSLLPTRQKFIDDIAATFAAGEETGFTKTPEQLGLFGIDQPKQTHLYDLKKFTLDELCAANPRLASVYEIDKQQRFLHWELAFTEVFVENRGFDLVVGNPPWIRPRWNESSVISDFDPFIVVRNISASSLSSTRKRLLSSKKILTAYFEEFVSQVGINNYLSSKNNFLLLTGIQTNLYKCFFLISMQIIRLSGVFGFVHDVGIYDDPKGGALRQVLYKSVAYYFRFYNQLNLFPEDALGHAGSYGITIARGNTKTFVGFDLIVNLFHPRTIDECYTSDGIGSVPGMRTKDDDWELRGHSKRIIRIEPDVLRLLCSLFEEINTNPLEAKLAIIHSAEILNTLRKFAFQQVKVNSLSEQFFSTVMYDETGAQKEGFILREVSFPLGTNEWVVSGPHFYVGCPYAKQPRPNCKSKGDYDDIDLTEINDSYLPRTIYKPVVAKSHDKVPKWDSELVTKFYRHIHRNTASPTNERTLIPAIIPPEVTHINAVLSIAFKSNSLMVLFNALCSSILYDFLVRTTGKTLIQYNVFGILPLPKNPPDGLVSRTLRLNCVSLYYAELWEELYTPAFNQNGWSKADPRLKPWSNLTPHWQRHVALRTPFERREALVEIDVLANMALGLTLEELLTIYRVQFPVLQKNEHRLLFDQRGMEVPVKTIGGELGVDESHPKFGEMVPPFTPVDREEDYRVAWKFFEERLSKGQSKSGSQPGIEREE